MMPARSISIKSLTTLEREIGTTLKELRTHAIKGTGILWYLEKLEELHEDLQDTINDRP